MRPRTYLDWNATAPLRVAARQAMGEAMDVVGNPSSIHGEGRKAKALIERARGQVADAFGADRSQIVFTSGATEAAAMVLAAKWAQVFASPVEHDAIAAHRDQAVNWQEIALYSGRANPDEVAAFGSGSKDLIVLQAANSETGQVQPLFETPPASGATLLCDAVQLAGKMPLALNWLAPQFTLLSAHKIGGPKGVGALLCPPGVDLPALVPGGGQEMGRRSGTENIIGIAGFGAAAEAAAQDLAAGLWDEVAERRDRLEARLQDHAPEVKIVGQGQPRLPNTTCLVLPGWKGETQVMQMDLAGFAISAGSACSSGKVKTSRVLRALGFDEMEASSAIRISIGPDTEPDQCDAFAAAWGAAYDRYRARAA